MSPNRHCKGCDAGSYSPLRVSSCVPHWASSLECNLCQAPPAISGHLQDLAYAQVACVPLLDLTRSEQIRVAAVQVAALANELDLSCERPQAP